MEVERTCRPKTFQGGGEIACTPTCSDSTSWDIPPAKNLGQANHTNKKMHSAHSAHTCVLVAPIGGEGVAIQSFPTHGHEKVGL